MREVKREDRERRDREKERKGWLKMNTKNAKTFIFSPYDL